MVTFLEYDGIVTSSRSCIALLCLALLCLAALTPAATLLLWALVLPLCLMLSPAVAVDGWWIATRNAAFPVLVPCYPRALIVFCAHIWRDCRRCDNS